MTQKLHLISFTICPFVQCARILLNAKKVTTEVTYIDLDNKPDWFLARVPTGKVPALFVDDATLFESTAINEYLDEVTPGTALGETPLERAEARAWIALSDDIIMAQYRMLMATDADGFAQEVENMSALLRRFEPMAITRSLAQNISLLDAAIAPVFMRNALIPAVRARLSEALPTCLRVWSQRLLADLSVKASVSDSFPEDFQQYFANRGSFVTATLDLEAV